MFDTSEKPLRASVNPESLPSKTTFFYEQPSGRVICVEEEEASLIHRKFKQVGVSDGKVFAVALAEAKKVQRETGELHKAQEILRQGQLDEQAAATGHLQRPRDYSHVVSIQNIAYPADMKGNILPPNPRT